MVNVPSEGLFRDQPRSYQETVLPGAASRYGLTSGLPVNLMGLVGEKGMIHGLDHFGYSAPTKCCRRVRLIAAPPSPPGEEAGGGVPNPKQRRGVSVGSLLSFIL